MRRVLSWLLSACIVCSALCGVAYGAEWTNIDEMGIDPWADLEAIQALPAPQEVSPSPEDSFTYALEQDVDGDVMPLSIGNNNYLFHVYGGIIEIGMYTGYGIELRNGNSFDVDKGFNVLKSGTIEGGNNLPVNIEIPSSSSYAVSVPISFLASQNTKVVLNGRLGAYFRVSYGYGTTESSVVGGGNQCVLLVNGQEVGEPQTGDSLNLSNYELDLTQIGDISSIGIMVKNTTGSLLNYGSTSDYLHMTFVKCGVYVADTMSITGNGQSASDEETKGLLNSIIQFLQSIIGGISNIATSIAQLPGLIVSGLMDGLKSLFIPSQSDFSELKSKYETLLSDKLGFVWQAGDWLISFGQDVLSRLQAGGLAGFSFPGISVPLPEGTFVILDPQTVNLDNAVMQFLRPTLGTIVSMICVVAFINTSEDMLVAWISGASYFDYLKGGKGNAD